jgi:uncharacterized protein YbjT (DUF2867 family)
MSNLPLISVVGATGNQGGSVINYLLQSKKFRLRGITRDRNSEKAKLLAEKGVEVVEANSNNREQIKQAFQGSYGVFAVTNFWDKENATNHSLEFQQGKLMADVAKEVGVQHYVWSSLHDVDAITKGEIPLPHFTGKNKVEQHILDIKLPATFVYAGYFLSNTNWSKTNVEGVLEFSFGLQPDTKIPAFDVEDTGGWVAAIFENKDKYLGKRIHMASEYIAASQLPEIYTKVTGKSSKFVPLPYDVVKKFMGEELANNFKWIEDYGYYNGEDISESVKVYPKATTTEQYFKKRGPIA